MTGDHLRHCSPQPGAPSDTPLLSAEGVHHWYYSPERKSFVTALEDLSLSVGRGSFIALLGPSGCGKSTLLNMFAGLIAPSLGTVRHDGQVIVAPNTRAAYVTQNDSLLPWRRVAANVGLPLEVRRVPAAQREQREAMEKARVATVRNLVASCAGSPWGSRWNQYAFSLDMPK